MSTSLQARDPIFGGESGLSTGRLTVDLGRLQRNYKRMCNVADGAEVAAVVKADAYALHVGPFATALWDVGCRTFFVAVPDEGVELRAILPDARIYILSSVMPEGVSAILDHKLTPMLCCEEDADLMRAAVASRGTTIDVALHMDSGMNRLGFSTEEFEEFATRSEALAGLNPILISTHLACADDLDSPMTEAQHKNFLRARAAMPSVRGSFCNSGGALHQRGYTHDLVRTGTALHGNEAIDGDVYGMERVAKLEARILQVRTVHEGETIGYGGTFTAQRDSRIAIAGIGYADGYHRSGSGSGVPLRDAVPQGNVAAIGGHRVPLVGRISMDVTTFDLTDLPEGLGVKGDYLELFGDNIPVEEAAATCGTIGYELQSSIGRRYARVYLPGNEDPIES